MEDGDRRDETGTRHIVSGRAPPRLKLWELQLDPRRVHTVRPQECLERERDKFYLHRGIE